MFIKSKTRPLHASEGDETVLITVLRVSRSCELRGSECESALNESAEYACDSELAKYGPHVWDLNMEVRQPREALGICGHTDRAGAQERSPSHDVEGRELPGRGRGHVVPQP